MALTRGLPPAESDAVATCAGRSALDESCSSLPACAGAGTGSAFGPGSGSATGPGSSARTTAASSGTKSAAAAAPPALTLQQVHVHAAGCVGSLVPGARPQLACALFDPVLFDTDALTQVCNPNYRAIGLHEYEIYQKCCTLVSYATCDLQIMHGFMLVVAIDGEVLFVTRTVEKYLGFHQVSPLLLLLLHVLDKHRNTYM